MTLFLSGTLEKDTVSWISWVNNLAMFSMWPLLQRDGLALQYSVVSLLYAWLMGTFEHLPRHWFGKVVHVGSYAAVLGLHVAEGVMGKVERWPDLWVVGGVEVCFGGFVVAWVWVLGRLWRESRRVGKKPKRE